MRVKLVIAALIATAAVTANVHASAGARVCAGLKGTVISFPASDGVRLHGAVVGKGRVGIVLAHEYGAGLCNWAPYANYLKARGFRLLLLDLRCMGESPCPATKGRVDADVAGAAAELRRRGAKKIVLAGASIGATASLVAAASLTPAPAAVISLSGASHATIELALGQQGYDLDPDSAVERFRNPVFFLAARDDKPFPGDARALYAKSASRVKKLMIVPETAHGTALLDPFFNPRAKRVRAQIVTFIRAHT